MKLTKREIDLIANIEKSRLRRKRGAWTGLVSTLVVWLAANYFDWLSNASSMVIGLFLGFSIVNLASAYSTIRADDKLSDVLQRYVNSDPEALRQLSSGQDQSIPQGQQKSV